MRCSNSWLSPHIGRPSITEVMLSQELGTASGCLIHMLGSKTLGHPALFSQAMTWYLNKSLRTQENTGSRTSCQHLQGEQYNLNMLDHLVQILYSEGKFLRYLWWCIGSMEWRLICPSLKSVFQEQSAVDEKMVTGLEIHIC